MKLCSKVGDRWEGVEGSLISVLLSKAAGVWPEREKNLFPGSNYGEMEEYIPMK